MSKAQWIFHRLKKISAEFYVVILKNSFTEIGYYLIDVIEYSDEMERKSDSEQVFHIQIEFLMRYMIVIRFIWNVNCVSFWGQMTPASRFFQY